LTGPPVCYNVPLIRAALSRVGMDPLFFLDGVRGMDRPRGERRACIAIIVQTPASRARDKGVEE